LQLSEVGKIFSYKFQDRNLGLNKGVFSGIDWFFENEKMGLIIEEDLILHYPSLSLADKLSSFVSRKNKIATINLRNTVPSIFIREPEYAYRVSSLASSHGWVTSREIWQEVPRNLTDWEKMLDANEIISKYGWVVWQVIRMRIAEQCKFEKMGNIACSWDTKLALYFYCYSMNSLNFNLNCLEYNGYDELSMNHTRFNKRSKLVNNHSRYDDIPERSLESPKKMNVDITADKFRLKYEMHNDLARFIIKGIRMHLFSKLTYVIWVIKKLFLRRILNL